MTGDFRVGLTPDFLDETGRNVWGDIGLGALDAAGLPWAYLTGSRPSGDASDELLAADIAGCDAVLFAAPAVTERTFGGAAEPPLILARFGVGYDTVDLDACTRRDVVVTITPDGARRPVAASALAMLLALQHRIVVKDRLVRTGMWEEKAGWMGSGLTGRTIGIVGFGSVAGDFASLIAPFRPRILAYDPHRTRESAAEQGAALVGLDELLAAADVVTVMAALTPETHHLLDERALGLMKPGAILVNVARGPIVHEKALTAALAEGRIAGAALDVFEREPLPLDSPLIAMDNVILSPHAISWTDEMALGNGSSAIAAILDVHAGRAPRFVANPGVLTRPGFKRRLVRQAEGRAA
jgi:phosphoglycerate dehydrogenase-like enzyme